MSQYIFWCLRKNSYKCCSVCDICFVKDKTYLAKCENAITDLLSQFVIPKKSDCQRQYDSHSYLLSHFSYLVNLNVFFNQKDYVLLKNTSLIFASMQQQKVTVFSSYSEIFQCNTTFPSATLKHVMQSVLSFCFKIEREGEKSS